MNIEDKQRVIVNAKRAIIIFIITVALFALLGSITAYFSLKHHFDLIMPLLTEGVVFLIIFQWAIYKYATTPLNLPIKQKIIQSFKELSCRENKNFIIFFVGLLIYVCIAIGIIALGDMLMDYSLYSGGLLYIIGGILLITPFRSIFSKRKEKRYRQWQQECIYVLIGLITIGVVIAIFELFRNL